MHRARWGYLSGFPQRVFNLKGISVELKERVLYILNYLKYIDEHLPPAYGTGVSTIRTLMSKNHNTMIYDSDIKYLIDKNYVESPISGKFTYMGAVDYLMIISAEGIDYLEEEKAKKATSQKPSQNIQVIQSEVAHVSQSGDVYHTTININDAFKQVYVLIDQETKGNPTLRAELTKEVKGMEGEIEEEVKKNNFEKIKEKVAKITNKARFLKPILESIVIEAIKKWVLGW